MAAASQFVRTKSSARVSLKFLLVIHPGHGNELKVANDALLPLYQLENEILSSVSVAASFERRAAPPVFYSKRCLESRRLPVSQPDETEIRRSIRRIRNVCVCVRVCVCVSGWVGARG